MKQIDFHTALDRIFANPFHAILAGRSMSIQYAAKDGESEDSSYKAYESDGCIVIVDDCHIDGMWFLTRTVCPVESTADPLALAKRLKDEVPDKDISILAPIDPATGTLLPELDKLYGWRVLGGHGMRYANDPFDCTIDGVSIRKMTSADQQTVLRFCDNTNDPPYAKMESGNFRGYAEDILTDNSPKYHDQREYHMLGAWDGEILMGLVMVSLFDTGRFNTSHPLALVYDILVGSNYRRKGVGRALVKASLSVWPDFPYAYQVHKENIASINTAKSTGFTFVGAELWI